MTTFLFIGGTERGAKLLEALLQDGRVPTECYLLQEDSHEVMQPSKAIATLLEERGIPCHITRKLEAADYAHIKENTWDLAVVCGWRTMIKPDILPAFRLGMIAAHDSLLPKYRGFAPLNWAIINGEEETGVSFFLINDGGVDTGKILEQIRVPILPNDYALDVYKRITQATIQGYRKIFADYEAGTISQTTQDETKATFTCKRIPADGKIHWAKPSKDIWNLIRALAYPYPGAFTEWNGGTYIIRRAALGKQNASTYVGRIPGRIIGRSKQSIEVLCGEGTIEIFEWERGSDGIIECPAETILSLSATLR